MNRKYRALLWDFDGVIFDSDKAVCRAVNVLLTHHGLQTIPYAEFRHRTDNHFEWYVKKGVTWGTEEIRNFFYRHYDTSDCGLVDGVSEVLAFAREQGLQNGIVSAHHTDDIRVKLARFGIDEHFPCVSGGTAHKKEALDETCATLGVACSEALFVGDMLSDVRDGRAAGVTTVLLAPVDSPHASEAHHHITDLRQLKSLFSV